MSDFRVEDIPSGYMSEITYSLKHNWSMLKIVKIIQAWNWANIQIVDRIRLAKAVMDSVRAERAKHRAESILLPFFKHTHTDESKAGCLACGEEDCPEGEPHHYRSRCPSCNPLNLETLAAILDRDRCDHPKEQMIPGEIEGDLKCGVCGEDGFVTKDDFADLLADDLAAAKTFTVTDEEISASLRTIFPGVEAAHNGYEYSHSCNDGDNGGGDGECLACGARDCPEKEALHYHHDGCPACDNPWDQPVPGFPEDDGSSHPFPGDHFMAISPPPVVYSRLVESWDAENVKHLAAKLTEAESEGKALLIDAKSVSGLLAWLS